MFLQGFLDPTNPTKQAIDILIVATAIAVILWVIYRILFKEATPQPPVVMLLGFMVTLIGWLALLGFSAVWEGYYFFELPWETIGIMALVVLILMSGLFHPKSAGRFVLVIFGGLWILVIALLAIVGLAFVDTYFVEENALTYLLISLILSLFLQIVLKFAVTQNGRSENNQRDHEEGPGEDR